MAAPVLLIAKAKGGQRSPVYDYPEFKTRPIFRFGSIQVFIVYRGVAQSIRQDKENWLGLVVFAGYTKILPVLILLKTLSFELRGVIKLIKLYLRKGQKPLIKYINYLLYQNTQHTYFEIKKTNENVFIGQVPVVKANWNYSEFKRDKVCYFASFNVDSIVSEGLLAYLGELNSQGFDIVFITTSPQCEPAERKKIESLVSCIIHRENIGHDFASWAVGILERPLTENINKVILANDSVFASIKSVGELISHSEEYDLFGVSSSTQVRYHIQSYFLVLNLAKKEMKNLFDSFWDDYRVVLIKDLVILEGEIGFTSKFYNRGAKVGALIELKEEFKSLKQGIDPTKAYWVEFVKKFDVPFIKKSVFRAPEQVDENYQKLSKIRKFLTRESIEEIDTFVNKE